MNLRILVFFVIGLLIFFLDIGFNAEQDSKDIYISDQELTSLLSAWKSQVGRPPSNASLYRISSCTKLLIILTISSSLGGLPTCDFHAERRDSIQRSIAFRVRSRRSNYQEKIG